MVGAPWDSPSLGYLRVEETQNVVKTSFSESMMEEDEHFAAFFKRSNSILLPYDLNTNL